MAGFFFAYQTRYRNARERTANILRYNTGLPAIQETNQ